MTEHELLVDEQARLIRVEERVLIIGTIAKLLWSLVLLFIVNFVGGVYAFSQLSEKVNNLDLDELQDNITTALVVLADHGTELQSVRTEQQRIRGSFDEMWTYHRKERQLVDEKTKDRFYKQDGDEIRKEMKEEGGKRDARIARLEEAVFFNNNGVK